MNVKYKITFEVEVDTNMNLESEGFKKALTVLMDDYQDGRYPLCVEMAEDALYRVIKAAVYDALCVEKHQIHGREMVEIKPGFSKAKWVIEADKEYNKLVLGVRITGKEPGVEVLPSPSPLPDN